MKQDSHKNRFMKCGETSQIFIAYNEYRVPSYVLHLKYTFINGR